MFYIYEIRQFQKIIYENLHCYFDLSYCHKKMKAHRNMRKIKCEKNHDDNAYSWNQQSIFRFSNLLSKKSLKNLQQIYFRDS